MHTEPTSEPIGSPVSGVIPEPVRRRNPASSVLSAVRDDKYMAGAYPPDGRGAAPDAEPSTTRAVSGTKGR